VHPSETVKFHENKITPRFFIFLSRSGLKRSLGNDFDDLHYTYTRSKFDLSDLYYIANGVHIENATLSPSPSNERIS
jgi:hypothetical protein